MLLVNKPSGPTSHDIVDEVRKVTGVKKVGHAGTLDPFAEGLLIVLVGREETKRQSEFMGLDKVYEATFVLGEERTTDDVEGDLRLPEGAESSSLESDVARSSDSRVLHSRRKTSNEDQAFSPARASRVRSSAPSEEKIIQVLEKFTGEYDQMPPVYSAKKIKGKKAYELARQGKKVELKPKKVTVYELELLEYKYPELKIRTKVSSGTYIRALARDIGRELGTGAYVSELKRTQIGEYKLKDASPLINN